MTQHFRHHAKHFTILEPQKTRKLLAYFYADVYFLWLFEMFNQVWNAKSARILPNMVLY